MVRRQLVQSFFIRLIQPAKPPANVALLVISRVTTVLLLFLCMVALTLAIIVRPWKIEKFDHASMEIGFWTICRFDENLAIIQCFNDFYKENGVDAWFDWWRYLMISAVCIKLLAFLYLCLELFRRRNDQRKPWVFVSYFCLLAGLLTFCSMITFYIKFEFEFLEDGFRTEIMGWTEETGDTDGFEEIVGYPYIMCWCSIVGTFLASYSSFYSKCQEDIFIKEYYS